MGQQPADFQELEHGRKIQNLRVAGSLVLASMKQGRQVVEPQPDGTKHILEIVNDWLPSDAKVTDAWFDRAQGQVVLEIESEAFAPIQVATGMVISVLNPPSYRIMREASSDDAHNPTDGAAGGAEPA